MATDYNGGPVEGGTYPAIIWQNFMTQALQIYASEHPKSAHSLSTTSTDSSSVAAGSGSTGGPPEHR